MSNIDILKFHVDDLSNDKLINLIKDRETFVILGISNMSHTVQNVENTIEKQGFKTRVYTENRSAGVAAAIIPTGVTQLTGLATAVGIGLHNLVTFNPDYELGKNIFNSSLTVSYKK